MPTGHAFPDITPSQRVYTAGTFPQAEFQGLNGAVTTLQYGVKTVDSKLEMTFQNISDAEANAILDNYEAVNSGSDDAGRQDYVKFPNNDSGAVKGVGKYSPTTTDRRRAIRPQTPIPLRLAPKNHQHLSRPLHSSGEPAGLFRRRKQPLKSREAT